MWWNTLPRDSYITSHRHFASIVMNTELDYKYNRLKIFKQLPAVFSTILAGLKEAQRREKTQARGTNVQSVSFSRKSYDHTVKLCGLSSQCLVHFDIICLCHCFYSQSSNFRLFAQTTSTWRCCLLESDIVYQRTSLLLIADVSQYIIYPAVLLFYFRWFTLLRDSFFS